MTGFILAWLGRVIASAIAFLCAWMLGKTGILVDAETQQKAVEVTVAIVLAIYAVVHKVLDRWLNPTDAAAPDVVSHDKLEVRSKRLSGQMRRHP